MNRAETAACYALVAKAYRLPAGDADAIEAWHLLLGDLPAPAVRAAVVGLCRTNRFAPNPAEITAEVHRAAGTAAPALDAAVGHYLAGRWDIHPAVTAAATAVSWDRRVAPDPAVREFRARYAAELDLATPTAAPAIDRPDRLALEEPR